MARIVSPRQLRGVLHTLGAPEPAAAWVADQQLGLVTFLQFEVVGFGRSAIASHSRRCLISRMFRGVYLYGHATPLPGAVELGAVLACGARTFVGGESALGLWSVIEPPEGDVHVTVVGRHCRTRSGIRVHSVEHLHKLDVTTINGIPVTSPARSLLDYAATATSDQLERAIAEAFVLRLVTDSQLHGALERAPHRAGVALLRAELKREGGPRWTRSKAERLMLSLLRKSRLPEPVTNIPVVGWPADFLWPDHKLIVEVDGWQFHRHRAAFERDRKRDAVHVTAGFRVIRVTMRQLCEEPLAVAVTIARALAVCEAG